MSTRPSTVVHVVGALIVALLGLFAPAADAWADECTRPVCIDRKMFYDGFREFNIRHDLGQERNRLSPRRFDAIQDILNRWDTSADLEDTRWLAYILATAFWETGGRMYAVREGLCDDSACAIAHLEELWAKRMVTWRYWDPDPTTGKSYYGRGQVQLTHLTNYGKVGGQLARVVEDEQFADLDQRLINEPDLALTDWVSTAALMEGMIGGWYNREFGKGLSSYINSSAPSDRAAYQQARRTVNVLDQNDRLAKYAIEIHRFIKVVAASEDHEASRAAATAEMDDVPPPVERVTEIDRGPVTVTDDDREPLGPRTGETPEFRPDDRPIDYSNPVGRVENTTRAVAAGAAAVGSGEVKPELTKREKRKRAKVRKKRKKLRAKRRKKRQKQREKRQRQQEREERKQARKDRD